MGQSPSTMRSRGGRQRSFRGFARRSKLNKSSLSHTFSLPTSEEYPELMNINIATEEQLMTLPGVNRQLARAIVSHRQIIGRFKRLDDLALVSGIGADKLESLRPEICTSTRKPISRSSSRTQSLESVKLNLENRLCSVNSASVFQLQCVPGLNQEIAANIVDHRNKKGPFKSLDDLIKVRGMDIVRLSTVKTHLSIESRKCESVQHLTNGYANGLHTEMNGSLPNGIKTSTPTLKSSSLKNTHRKSLSMPIRLPVVLPNGYAAAPVNDILDLLSAYSHRPVIQENFKFERNGNRCCRVATWNLHELSVDKINNPGVREVVCRTILENKFSIIALQDVLEETSLRIIVEELNMPVLGRVKEWKSNSNRWNYCWSDLDKHNRLGFIYDAASKANISVENMELDEIISANTTEDVEELLERYRRIQKDADNIRIDARAFIICNRQLIIVNVTCSGELPPKEVLMLTGLSLEADKCGVQIMVMGDFYHWDNITSLESAFEPVIDQDVNTKLDHNTKGQCCILSNAKTDFNGTSGVIKSGLSHLAIPRGWSWGGPASIFCPIYAEYNLPD